MPRERSVHAETRWGEAGDVPESQYAVMRAPFQEGDLPGPVRYGYLNGGVVEEGPAGSARAYCVLSSSASDRVCGSPRAPQHHGCSSPSLRRTRAAGPPAQRRSPEQQPGQTEQLSRLGVTVTERVPTGVCLTPANAGYLAAKASRAAHALDLPFVRE